MSLLPFLLHISAIHIVMAMIPGPNTVVVSHCSASVSRATGLRAAAGVAAASLVWVSLSLTSVSVLLMQAGPVFSAMRLLGALYLVYVGVRMMRAKGGVAGSEGRVPSRRYRSPFLAGFMTTLSNPKSAVFWTSVFTLVLPDHAPGWFYATIMAIIAAQAFLWYGAVAVALSTRIMRANYARLTAVLNRIAGGFMLFFGLKIANELRLEFAKRAI